MPNKSKQNILFSSLSFRFWVRMKMWLKCCFTSTFKQSSHTFTCVLQNASNALHLRWKNIGITYFDISFSHIRQKGIKMNYETGFIYFVFHFQVSFWIKNSKKYLKITIIKNIITIISENIKLSIA